MSDKTLDDKALDATFDQALAQVIGNLVKRADDERQKSEPWKQLFAASEGGLKSLLSAASHQTNSIILSLTDVIEKTFGIKCSHKLYDLLKALPFAMNKLRDTIQTEHGHSCCADKARAVYYEEVLAEIKRIKEAS